MADENYHDEKAAQKVIQFIERFCCQKNGTRIKLLPWQIDLIRKLYGTKQPDGLRQYRQCFAFVPRRNGKSVLAASLLMYHLCFDPPASELYLLSNTITQSEDACYAAAVTMATHSPALRRCLKVLKSKGRIVNTTNNSRLVILSSEANSLMGKDAQLLLFDEIAFFKDRRLYANLKGSQLNRKQPLSLAITTASDNEEGIGKELYDYAVKVKNGTINNPSFLPVLYAAEPSDDWTSPTTWAKANPSLNTLIQQDDIRKLCEEAQQEPRKESEFKQFHLNLFQHSSACFISQPTWQGCRDEFTEDDLIGMPCHCGIDLARRHDLAAVVYVFTSDDKYYLLPRFFLPEQLAKKKEMQDNVPYTTWASQGLLILTDGDVIDYSEIRKTINADDKKFSIQQCGFDPWNAELLCNQQLRLEDGINCVEVRQSIVSMGQPTNQFDKLLREKRIRHNNNPILNWMAANLTVREDSNGNVMPDKKHSTARIDGITAAIIGLSRAIAEQELQPNFSFI